MPDASSKGLQGPLFKMEAEEYLEYLKMQKKQYLSLRAPMHRKLISTQGMSRAMVKKHGRADTEREYGGCVQV